MTAEVPAELQLLIRGELCSGSRSGRRRAWHRPTVLAVDMADDVAAALLWQRDGAVASAMFECSGSRWRLVGSGTEGPFRKKEIFGSRPAGPALMLAVRGNAFARRAGWSNAGWVASGHLRLAREVSYLEVDGRRVDVPAHGHAVVVWAAAQESTFLAAPRPRIVACRHDGMVLSGLDPTEFVDRESLRGVG